MTKQSGYDNISVRTLKTEIVESYDSNEFEGVDIMELKNYTLGRFVQYWLTTVKAINVKSGTLNRLCTEANALTDYPINDMKICDIRVIHIQRYIDQLIKRGYAYTTIAKQRLIVTAPLKYAYDVGVIDKDCTSGVKMPAKKKVLKPKKEIVALTQEEQAKLLKVCEGDTRPNTTILMFILETGLRIGEAQALKWEDVDFRNKTIRVRRTVLNGNRGGTQVVQSDAKTESSNRKIPLSQKAINILHVMEAQQVGDFIFSDTEQAMCYDRICKRLKSLCRRANVPYYGIHSLRHTFATNCYYKGCNIKILSKLLGHSSTTITYNTYIDLYDDGLEDMRAIVN